jgi:hypothetical protein
MKDFQKNIDKLVSKILNEEIETKIKRITETKGQWMEVDKEEVDEYYTYSDAEELSQDEPTYVGKGLMDNKIKNKITNKMFGSFDDEHGWFDQDDRQHSGDFDFDFDEEEFSDFPSFIERHGENQRWFDPKGGEGMFNKYKENFGDKPFRVRTKKSEMDENIFKKMFGKKEKPKVNVDNGKKHPSLQQLGWDYNDIVGWHSPDNPQGGRPPSAKEIEKYYKDQEDREIEEAETEEGNAFGYAVKKAKEAGKKEFEFDDKEYNVSESNRTLSLSEDELIDLIENIVKEEMVKDIAEKNTFNMNKPQGLKKTEKTQGESKKENDKYAKEVVEKMKKYMKGMTMGGEEYNESPEDFPQSNYDMEKEHKEMKYHPSEAVEEYIEAFAYPGQTQLVFDEIKPEDKKIDKYLKGDSTTGNAIENKEGKALGNVSKRSTKTGERFKKNYDENLYGAEQMKGSYKRQSQPVDVAGNETKKGKLKDVKNSSINKADKIMSQLESIESKTTKIINEDLQKMKNLISYNRKTQ